MMALIARSTMANRVRGIPYQGVYYHRTMTHMALCLSPNATLRGMISSLAVPTSCVLSTRQWTHPSTAHRRHYSFLGQKWDMKKVQYTKYRITKPWTADTMFDDIHLAGPSKDDFAKFTKDTPVFLRFLKLVCDLEARPQVFIEFAKRCEGGLVVEKDVYITKQELMDCIWKNGFNQTEINAFELAFPSEYKFHYPELAVLFDLTEEDCYKYCIKQRASKPEELVELKYQPPKNLLSSYGLCFLGVWFGLSNTVLSNAWFYSKTIPFGAVFYMLASYYYRQIREYWWKEENALVSAAKEKKEKGEELVYSKMKQYSQDARCLEFLSSFKSDVQKRLTEYRRALLFYQKRHLVEQMTQKLVAIQQAERAIQGSLQEVMVREVLLSFREAFAKDLSLRAASLSAAVAAIGGHTSDDDPVSKHFKSSFQLLQTTDLSKSPGRPDGTVTERVAAVFQQREKEFMDQFTIKEGEAEEVKRLASKCKSGSAFEFDKLSAADLDRFNELYRIINNRVGYTFVDESALQPIVSSDPSAQQYSEFVNKHIEAAVAKMKSARLTAFAQAFA